MAKPMADYFSTVTADYTAATLDIPPHVELWEECRKEQFVHKFSDGQRGTVTLSNQAQYEVTLQWKFLSPTDAGTIIDLYNSATKANGMARSFYWSHPSDGQDYTVKFAEPLSQGWRAGQPNWSEVKQIKLHIRGVKP